MAPAGKEIGIIKLLDNLNSSVFQTFLFVFSGLYHFNKKKLQRFNTIYLKKRNGNDIRLPFKLAYYFRLYKIDIVHTHSWGTLVEGIIGARLGGVPIIIHGEHGTFPERIFHRWIQKIFWKQSNIILSVSANLSKKLSESINVPSHRIKTIINGVNESIFFPSEKLNVMFRERFNFSHQDFIVGTVGRLSKVKNHSMLIGATAELIQKGEIVQVVLVGEGSERKGLERFINKLKIQKYVHFLGYQKNINLILNGLDIFVLTSFSEGCSNVIQEAMFTEKPIIATDVGGNSELVKSEINGYLVKSNDYKELANKIMDLKNKSDLRQRFGKYSLEFARRNFSLKAMIDQYQDLYIKFYTEKSKE